MVYEKIIYFSDNTPNEPSKFRTKNWVEVNDNLRVTYSTNSQVKFKTSSQVYPFLVMHTYFQREL